MKFSVDISDSTMAFTTEDAVNERLASIVREFDNQATQKQIIERGTKALLYADVTAVKDVVTLFDVAVKAEDDRRAAEVVNGFQDQAEKMERR